jgi:hypothetical protein
MRAFVIAAASGMSSLGSAVVEVPIMWPRSDGRRYGADDASIALCLVGHYRTLFHPATIGANLAAFEHLPNLERFAVLSLTSDFHVRTDVDQRVQSKQHFEAEHAAGLARYNFSSLLLLDDNHTFATEFFRTGNCKPGGKCVGIERVVCRKGCETGTRVSPKVLPLCNPGYMKQRAVAKESPENWVIHLLFNFIFPRAFEHASYCII